MLVNPINFRLGVSTFWKITWSLYTHNNYKYLFHWDLIFFEYLSFFLKKIHIQKKDSDFYISHVRFYRMKKKIVINFYYYYPKGYLMYLQLKKSFLKKNSIKKKNKKKYISAFNKKSNNFYLDELRLEKQCLIKPFTLKKPEEQFNKSSKFFFVDNPFLIKRFLKIIRRRQKKFDFNTQKIILKKKNNKYFLLEADDIKEFTLFGKQIFFNNRRVLWYLQKYFKDQSNQKQEENAEKSKKKSKKNLKKKITLKKQKKIKYNFKQKKKILLFTKIKKINKKNKSLKKLIKIKNYILKNNFFSKTHKKNFTFTSTLYIKKFIFSCKLFFYNLYIYFWSKFLKKESKKNFLKNFGNLKVNGYQIALKNVNARIIVRYLQSTLQSRHNIWFGLRKVVADLNKRVLMQNIQGYKILFCGRFKRASRASYIWRKNGHFLIGSPHNPIDYEVGFHRTKYGVGAIKIWLLPGDKSFKYYQKMYPAFKAFFFFDKKKYFYLKKNVFFFDFLFKHFNVSYSPFNFEYIKNAIITILYTYLYTNIFLKKLDIKQNQLKKITKNFKKIVIPHYFVYKISNPLFWQIKYLKIKPFIDYNFLKKINIRNSYKLNILNKEKKGLKKKINLKRIKYKIRFLRV